MIYLDAICQGNRLWNTISITVCTLTNKNVMDSCSHKALCIFNLIGQMINIKQVVRNNLNELSECINQRLINGHSEAVTLFLKL